MPEKSSQRIRIFIDPEAVTPVPADNRLYLSGFSVVLYYSLHLEQDSLGGAWVEPSVREVSGEMSYAAKLRTGTRMRYSELVPAGTLPSLIADTVGARSGEIRQALIWTDPEYLLGVIPLVFSMADNNWLPEYLALSQAVGVDDVLAMLAALTRSDVAEGLVGSAVDALVDSGAVNRSSVSKAMPITDSLGLQLWDLGGSIWQEDGSARPDVPYSALEDSRHYAWELSALMSYPVDHVIEDHLWRRRNPSQVFDDVNSGYTMLGDHMVFLNHCCCLEISHLPNNIKKRSKLRIINYGFDSSAIFVWTIANLRFSVIQDLRDRYHRRLWWLMEKESVHPHELLKLVKEQPRHAALADQLMSISDSLREKRLRELDAEIIPLQFRRDPIVPLTRDMREVRNLTMSLVNARSDALRGANNTLLAVMAFVLTVIGVPGIVEQVANWLRNSEWTRASVALFMMITILGVLLAGWRRRSRWK